MPPFISSTGTVGMILADWSVKSFDTTGQFPEIEMFPGDDIVAWETADVSAAPISVPSGGVPAVWSVPTDEGPQRILYASLTQPERCGLYLYTPSVDPGGPGEIPGSFVRLPEAATLGALHGTIGVAKLSRGHTDEQPITTGKGNPWIPNLLYFQVADLDGTIDVTNITFENIIDLPTVEAYNTFVIGITGFPFTPNASHWATAVPADLSEAVNRLAAAVFSGTSGLIA